MITSPASRHLVGVLALALDGSESVLEIGCGHGVATRLLLERLGNGQVTALDRSQKMIDAVIAGSPDALAAGKLAVRAEALEDADFGGQTFAGILAINVDFNLRLGTRWPATLAALLAPGGRLVLAFDPPPGAGKGEALVNKTLDRLDKGGFTSTLLPAHGRVSVIRAAR